MPRPAKLLAAVAVACLAAAGGKAFTDANTGTPTGTQIGFSSTTVSGAVLQDIHYDINATGTRIVTTYVRVQGDTHTSAMGVGFNGQAVDACATGTYTNGSPGYTDYVCTTGGTNATTATSAITSVEIIVH